MEKTILHCDMNNYYASVESIGHPEYSRIPLAVCGDPATRHGIVLSKNYEAKKYGIITGESSYAAMMKCPPLKIVFPDYRKYLGYAERARAIFREYTDKVYPYGIDEAWLDVTESCEGASDGKRIADELRFRIKKELMLTASVGVSFNYIFAKLASDMKKPDATSLLPKSAMKDTIWDMPAFDMLFVGASTRRVLRGIGILTIGDIAKCDPSVLIRKLGKKGKTLWEFANGDDSSFDPRSNGDDDIKSLGNTVTPPKDIKSQSDAEAFMYVLSQTVSKRLRKHGFVSSRIGINVRNADFSRFTRQKTLYVPVDGTDEIFRHCTDLLSRNFEWKNSIRSIGIRADGLSKPEYLQTCLFGDEEVFPGRDEAIRSIKEKYGSFGLEETTLSRDNGEISG